MNGRKILSLLLMSAILIGSFPTALALEMDELLRRKTAFTAVSPDAAEQPARAAELQESIEIDRERSRSDRSLMGMEDSSDDAQKTAALLDENLSPLTWDDLTWELTEGAENKSFGWNGRDQGKPLHTKDENNGAGNFVVLGVMRSSEEMGVGTFTFHRNGHNSCTAIRYFKFRPGGYSDEDEESGVVPFDANGAFSVTVSEEEGPWAYEVTYGTGTSLEDFVPSTYTYGFNFQVNRYDRLDPRNIDWKSNGTIFDADISYPDSDCGYFDLYVKKDVPPSNAEAELIFYSPYGNNENVYARYWSFVPGYHSSGDGTTVTHPIVSAQNGFVSIPVKESDGSMVYGIEFGRKRTDGSFYATTYDYFYQIFYMSEMTWDNVSCRTENAKTLSEYKFPAVSDDWLCSANQPDIINWLDVPVEGNTGTMTVTFTCPERLRNVSGLFASYCSSKDGWEWKDAALTNGSFTLPFISVSADDAAYYYVQFGVNHEETEDFYGYYEWKTTTYGFEMNFRPAEPEDYLPVSITDWRHRSGGKPSDWYVRIHNRQNVSGTLIVAAYTQDDKLIKAVPVEFTPDMQDWIFVDGIKAVADQAAYVKAFAVETDTLKPLCPSDITRLYMP